MGSDRMKVGPELSTTGALVRREDTGTCTGECDWSDALTSQGLLAAPGSQEEAREGPPLEVLRGQGPAHTLISASQPPELRANEFLLF